MIQSAQFITSDWGQGQVQYSSRQSVGGGRRGIVREADGDGMDPILQVPWESIRDSSCAVFPQTAAIEYISQNLQTLFPILKMPSHSRTK